LFDQDLRFVVASFVATSHSADGNGLESGLS